MDAEVPLGLPLEYIVNHVFLPPKLPQQLHTIPEFEVALKKAFHDALNSFIQLMPDDAA